jgi:hypothetical protein
MTDHLTPVRMAVTKNNNKKVTYAGNNVDRKGAHTQ